MLLYIHLNSTCSSSFKELNVQLFALTPLVLALLGITSFTYARLSQISFQGTLIFEIQANLRDIERLLNSSRHKAKHTGEQSLNLEATGR